MPIAIQREQGTYDAIMFDAVLSYSSSYSSRLTQHPVDGAGVISDHVTVDSQTFTLKGIISNADFHSNRPLNTDGGFVNDSPINEFTTVKVNDSVINVFNSLANLGKKPEPEVTVQDRDIDFVRAAKKLLLDIRDKKESVSLVEFENGQPVRSELGLIITSLQFSEDPDTGDASIIDLQLQKAKFVDLKVTKIGKGSKGKDVDDSIKDKAAETVKKGDQTKVPTNLKEAADSLGVSDKVGNYTDSVFSIYNEVKQIMNMGKNN